MRFFLPLPKVTRGSRACPLSPKELQDITDETDAEEALAMFHEMIRSHLWYKNETLQERLRLPLMKLCAQYLYQEKHRGLALNGVGMRPVHGEMIVVRDSRVGSMRI